MGRWDVQRMRSAARPVVEWIAWLLLVAVFLGGIVWSFSRQDERGPVAKVVAGVLLAVIGLAGVAEAVIAVAFSVTATQLLYHGIEGSLLFRMLFLVFASVPILALQALAWLVLLLV